MRFVLMAIADGGGQADPGAPDRAALDRAALDRAALDRAALDRYGAELVRAGVLLAAEALEPAAVGACLRYSGEQRILSRPAPGAVSRFWMLQTAGEDEALEWARRMPLTTGTVEVRRVTDDEGR
ncbi:hypothetical protein [Leifsonia sp. SIMBA_070]|uniref:hypothetical protein n=1 Tax=Leifsonia sp. SIMBA_070 TaxID=3085810 RepID=UPI00397E5B55